MVLELIIATALQIHPLAEHEQPTEAEIASVTACAPKASDYYAVSACLNLICEQHAESLDGGISYEETAICQRKELAIWDARLNAAYRELMSDYEVWDDLRASYGGGRDALRAAQRAWIGYRDASCAHRVFNVERRPYLYEVPCNRDLTAQRALELEALDIPDS